ncbi:MAG TPA: AraC family transcriptional regulator [Cyclobacteriaceae bacterium]|nr:AraC family transcriptional regulator [Cyclobacteriaceae bacterium]
MYSTLLVLRTIIYGAVAQGADLQKMCDSIGITPAELLEPERKIDGVEAISGLWENILDQTKDPSIGLHIGAGNNLTILGLVGYVIHSCPTVKEAWEVLQKNQRLLSGWVSYDMQINKDDSQFIYTIDPIWVKASPHTAWQGAEITMAGLINSLLILTGKNIYPKRAEVIRPRTSTDADYEKVFHCPVKFSAPANKLVFSADMPNTPIISADSSLYFSFSQLLAAKATEHAANVTFAEQIKSVVMKEFKGQVPAVEIIASHMNMSSRSFQRKLEGEGVSYRAISEEIKKELTLALLKNPKYNSNEISRALGYAEPTAFRLAFKRWMDETPAQWRKRNNVKAA